MMNVNISQRMGLYMKQSPQQVLLSTLLQLPILSLEQKISLELEQNPLLEEDLEMEEEMEQEMEEELELEELEVKQENDDDEEIEFERWCRELKQTLGCGGVVDGDTIVLQGDLRSRMTPVLEARGVGKVTLG